jgi:hypothetical protein
VERSGEKNSAVHYIPFLYSSVNGQRKLFHRPLKMKTAKEWDDLLVTVAKMLQNKFLWTYWLQ